MNSGERANRQGKRLENFVEQSLNDYGYVLVSPQRFRHLCILEQPIYTRQCTIGVDLYQKKRRVDFILYHPEKWSDCLVIQCKWQSSRGSVEEKYPFEVGSIEINRYPTIIILDGGGYSRGAKAWLESQASPEKKLTHVMDLGAFTRFISQGNL